MDNFIGFLLNVKNRTEYSVHFYVLVIYYRHGGKKMKITTDIFSDENRAKYRKGSLEMDADQLAALEEIRREEEAQRESSRQEWEEYSKDRLFARFLNSHAGEEMGLDKELYWDLKHSKCHICHKEPVRMDFKYYKDTLNTTSAVVCKVVKTLGYTGENTVSLCRSCFSMTKKADNIYMAVLAKLDEKDQYLAKQKGTLQGKESSRAYVAAAWRLKLKEKEETGWI